MMATGAANRRSGGGSAAGRSMRRAWGRARRRMADAVRRWSAAPIPPSGAGPEAGLRGDPPAHASLSTAPSISAPTIAGCWLRCRATTASGSSMPFRASCGSARGSATPGGLAKRPWAGPSRRSRSAARSSPIATSARARMIATEACRSAANGAEFVARVRDETGLELEIVSRETEARLAVAGCASLVDPNAGRRHPLRHRRWLVGAGLARQCRRSATDGGGGCRTASANGCRCRWAWSASASGMAAAT